MVANSSSTTGAVASKIVTEVASTKAKRIEQPIASRSSTAEAVVDTYAIGVASYSTEHTFSSSHRRAIRCTTTT